MPTGYGEAIYLSELEAKVERLEAEVKKYKRLSLKDPLTNLWNERKLKEDLKRYVEIQKRSEIKFTVALIDIDNFKQYNDKYGHEYGNKILKQVAKVLKNSIRKYENVYRIGGGADEFIIILSHSNNPLFVIERIIDRLLKKDINCSIGYATLDKDILKTIDERMYDFKQKKK